LKLRTGKALRFLVFTILAAVCLTEASFAMLLKGPSWFRRLPFTLRRNVQNVYMRHVRRVIQFDPASARYDPELFDTLKPGDFTFSNPEFSVRFHVNSVGVRDSEEALKAPEMIALGDSLTMGWGVEREETYPRLLARATGWKTLNAGIAGFGTAREMRLLNRLDTSKLKILLIQYDEGLTKENASFYCSGNRLLIGSPESFARALRDDGRRYRFGKYTLLAISKLADALRPRRRDAEDADPPPGCKPPGDTELFLNALTRATEKKLEGVKLVIFTIGCYQTEGREFLSSLRRELDSGRYPDLARRTTLAVMDDRLAPTDYFVIDGHLNPSGQRRVAEELLKVLPRRQPPDGETLKKVLSQG
jgi:hypothetical protein